MMKRQILAARFREGSIVAVATMLPILFAALLAYLIKAIRPENRGELIAVALAATLCFVFFYPNFTRRAGNYLAFFAGAVAYFVAPETIHSEKFYELTVQVAPVLFIALALDARAYRYRVPRDINSVESLKSLSFIGVPAFFLVVAGFESYRVIIVDNPAQGTFKLVVGALIAAALSLFFIAIFGPASPDVEQPENHLDRGRRSPSSADANNPRRSQNTGRGHRKRR